MNCKEQRLKGARQKLMAEIAEVCTITLKGSNLSPQDQLDIMQGAMLESVATQQRTFMSADPKEFSDERWREAVAHLQTTLEAKCNHVLLEFENFKKSPVADLLRKMGIKAK